jgi:hypothetical protein
MTQPRDRPLADVASASGSPPKRLTGLCRLQLRLAGGSDRIRLRDTGPGNCGVDRGPSATPRRRSSVSGRPSSRASPVLACALGFHQCMSPEVTFEKWLTWEHDRSALQAVTFSRSPASRPAPTALRAFPQKERETAVGKRRRHATCNLRFPAYDRQQQKCQIGVHLHWRFMGPAPSCSSSSQAPITR